MGTTLTAVVVAGGRQLLIGHVGDSRAYLLHDGVMRRITDDHSLVEELVREGRLTAEQAESHPRRVDRHPRARRRRRRGGRSLHDRGRGRRPHAALLRRAHDDGPRPRRRAPRAQRARPAARGRGARRSREPRRRRRQHERRRGRRARGRRRPPRPTPSCSPRPPRPHPRDGARARARTATRTADAYHASRGAAASAARCCCSCRSSSCSASRSAASAGTRAARTTSASSANRVVIYKGVPGGVLGWNPTVDQTHAAHREAAHPDRPRPRRRRRRARIARRREALRRHPRSRTSPRPRTTTTTTTKPVTDHDRPRSRDARPGHDGTRPVTTALADDGPRADRPPAPPRRALARSARRDHRGRRLHPRRARQRTDAPARPRRAPRVGVRPLPRRPLRDPPLRAQRRRDACSRSPRSSTASASSRSRASTTTRRACSRCGSRSGSACSWSRSSSSATCASSSATATRSPLLGLGTLLLPLAPSIGRTINGARLWVAFGSLTFEPSEIAKVLLVAFFAAYLVDKRELLSQGRVRVGRCYLPSLRDLGPLLLAWGVALLVLGYEKDVGTSLLFFGVFAAMLYIATRRGAYLARHARSARRSDRCSRTTRSGTCACASTRGSIRGGRARAPATRSSRRSTRSGRAGSAGPGSGSGAPTSSRTPPTDFVFAAIGEELGLVGTIGVVAAFMLLVGSAFRIAADATRPFAKLFAAGIATILGFQTFLIIGGVTRVIPLTGITLPFVSYGGSSLVANFALLAILLRISDDTARARGSNHEHRHPPRRPRDHGAVPRARRAAHLPPGRRTAGSSPTTRTTPASSSRTSASRAARS